MERHIIKSIIADQNKLAGNQEILERNFPESLVNNDLVVVITGVRRCGKSTLLHQIRHRRSEKDYYFNFDDDRLIHFKVEDFQALYEIFLELFGKQKTFYFDEIQNVEGWERFIRRLHDYGNKIFLTGSNARMLSREMGTHLTGRYVSYELFPFSFREYLEYKGSGLYDIRNVSTEEKAELMRHYHSFTKEGGFPKYLKTKDRQYLRSLFEGIVYRDVMVRNKLTNEREILELVTFLAANVSSLASYNSLANTVGISNATTIKNYITFLRNSYLVFPVSKFDYSLKRQIQNPKKIYFIDPALVGEISFRFSENHGRMLENQVFLELFRRGYEVFYHKRSVECDFIIRKSDRITAAIQVTHTINDPGTYAREVKGLSEAMNHYNLEKGLIITENEQGSDTISGKDISITPAWKWLLKEFSDD